MGVTVSGTPQRVTALNLADLGLDGELSGLLGELTGLTELRLGGNPLTGMLPSKLALLTNLMTVSLSGTDFEGCAPPVLRQAATNDISGTGLDDCGPPAKLPSGRAVIPPGTYRWDLDGRYPPIVFDIPPGVELIYGGMVFGYVEEGDPPSGSTGFGIQNASRTASLGIDAEYLRAWNRGFLPGSYDQAIDEAFDRIIQSLWAEAR